MTKINQSIYFSIVLAVTYSTINVLGTALKQPITRSKMSIFHSRLELGVPDDMENCPPLLFFSYDQNLMTAENF